MSDSRSDIERVEYASMLYDFYGSLLNEAGREVMALYHEDDMSLSEIAEELGQTRQAVHYTLKRSEKALESYEEKLGLIASYKTNQSLAERACSIIESADLSGSAEEELKKLIKQMAE